MAARTSKRPVPSMLQSAYRRALSAAVVAHARFLAVQDDASATVHRTARCQATWLALEARKARLLARLNAAQAVPEPRQQISFLPSQPRDLS